MMADPFDTPDELTGPLISNGRYRLPDPVTGKIKSWTRATTWAETLADTYLIQLWQQRMAVKGLALRPDLYALAASMDATDRDGLNKVAASAMEAAKASARSNLGTALHAFTHAIERGEDHAAPADLVPDLDAYRAKIRDAEIKTDPHWTERTCIVPSLNVAGTFDRIVEHDGELVILDLKTGDRVGYAWGEIEIQLAVYSRATHAWIQGKTGKAAYEPMPEVSQTRGLVLHLPVGQARAELYPVDLAHGWRGAELCGEVRMLRRISKQPAPLPDRTPGMVHPPDVAIKAASSREQLSAIWRQAKALGMWTSELEQLGKARLAEIEAA